MRHETSTVLGLHLILSSGVADIENSCPSGLLVEITDVTIGHHHLMVRHVHPLNLFGGWVTSDPPSQVLLMSEKIQRRSGEGVAIVLSSPFVSS